MNHRQLASLVRKITSLCVLLTCLSVMPAYTTENINKVELISPSLGSSLVPEKSTIVLRFTGPDAMKSNECDRGFRFWMLGTDAFGHSALFSRTYNSPTSEGLLLMEGHTSKVIPEGIECSINLGKQIESRSNTQISDMMYKSDWAKTYLEDHKLAADSASVAKFVEGWTYLVKNPKSITRVTISSLGLAGSFVLQPTTFRAISGARELQVPLLTRGAMVSTGTPLTVKYSGAPNEIPKSVSIFIKAATNNGQRECLLLSNDTNSGARTELTYSCRIPRIYAPGQVEISALTTDSTNMEIRTDPVVINLTKSLTEKLDITASASECGNCGNGVIRLTGKVNWVSEKGPFPLFNQDLTICGEFCPVNPNVRTNGLGEFSIDLKYADPNPTSQWDASWAVYATASDLKAELRGKYTFVRPIKTNPTPTKAAAPIEPQFNMNLNLTTKSKINWGDQVVGIVKATGKGSGTCVAQFQEELKTFTLKAGQTKTIKFNPQYAENKKFALNVGCSPNANWWGRFFDPRYSWNYAKAKTFKYVTMIVSSNLDGY